MWGLDREPRSVHALLGGVLFMAAATFVYSVSTMPAHLDWIRIVVWIVLTLIAAASPVRLPGGLTAQTTTTPLIGVIFDSTFPSPFATCVVAFVGTFAPRDFRRQVAFGPLGTLYNRSNYLISGYAGWSAAHMFGGASPSDPLAIVGRIVAAGVAFTVVNQTLAVSMAALRTRQSLSRVWALSSANVLASLAAQIPLGWLMAEVAVEVGLWAAFMVMIPLQLARYSMSKYTEMRELFFGSISALSQAIDAKDGFTRGHADRVSRIAGAIAREMGIPEREIEQIELAALLHDIGKIGVEDRILLKPTRLEPDERTLMHHHTVYGAAILEPSTALRPLVPLVLHHHENYDGTGYPDGLKGEEIPLGSRVIIVADAYEAMTSDRVYRKAPGHERAMEQLHRFKGAQFDPRVVRALDQLMEKHGMAAFDRSDLPPINYETLAELRRRLAQGPIAGDAHAF
ncbi:MAG: HD-GYP domain-containing protein [Chloroflexota bacterium]|nr:HD-GYP domain-containing protein [Chloroflexota bacterium]